MIKKFALIGIITALALAVTACGGGGGADAAEEGQPMGEPVAMEEEGPVNESVEAYGIVEATNEQSISVDFNARVNKIYVKAGERISKGDKLVDFDISVLENEIASKKMEINETQFELDKKDYSVSTLELDVKNAEAQLSELEDEFVKKEALYNSGAVSKDEFNKLSEQVEAQKRTLDKLKLNLKSTSNELSGNRQSMENKMTRLQDELQRLEDKYKKANFVNGNQIVSTIENGVVSEVGSKEGSYVDREVSVLTIVDLDSRIVRADIAEEFIGRIYEGQPATVTSQAVPDKQYPGKVVRIWGTSIKKGGETIVPIEIALDDMDDKLFLNFNVDVKIELEETQESTKE